MEIPTERGALRPLKIGLNRESGRSEKGYTESENGNCSRSDAPCQFVLRRETRTAAAASSLATLSISDQNEALANDIRRLSFDSSIFENVCISRTSPNPLGALSPTPNGESALIWPLASTPRKSGCLATRVNWGVSPRVLHVGLRRDPISERVLNPPGAYLGPKSRLTEGVG